MPCSLPRGTGGVRGQGIGIADPYLALIARTIFRAMRWCVTWLGWTPSQLNASPNGEPLHAAAVFGNGANWLATPASESRVKFTLSVNAHPRAVACAWMIALYRS